MSNDSEKKKPKVSRTGPHEVKWVPPGRTVVLPDATIWIDVSVGLPPVQSIDKPTPSPNPPTVPAENKPESPQSSVVGGEWPPSDDGSVEL
jgi:hypothetical protein